MASNIVGGNEVNFAFTDSGAVTWSVGAHTNGGVVISLSHTQTNLTRPMTALTVGGVAFTKIHGAASGDGSPYAYEEVWACNAASAAGISANPTIAVTVTAGGSGACAGTIVTVTDVNQTLANWIYASDGENADVAMSAALAGFSAGNLVFGGVTVAAGSGFSIVTNGGDAVTEFTGSDRAFNTSHRCVAFYGAAASTTPTIGADSNSTSATPNQCMVIVGIPAYAASGPTITSTSDDTPTNGTNLTINGAGFGATQGTGGVTLDGAAVTPSSWSDTTIVIPIALGQERYDVDLPIVVTADGGAASSAHNIKIQPASGVEFFNLSGTLAAANYRLRATPDLANTDQIEVSEIIGGTTADFQGFSDGSYRTTLTVTRFKWRIHNSTEWGPYTYEYPQSRELRALAIPLAIPLSITLSEGY